MEDKLGDRMKSQYEDRTRYSLPRRTYTIIRLDGKSFHTYTRGLKKPFDTALIEDMDYSVIGILPEIQGAQFAYVQSDEISILLTDFEKPSTSAWFDGNIQKICSVSASLITSKFNQLRAKRWKIESDTIKNSKFLASNGMDEEASDNTDFETSGAYSFKLANFDSRVFTIPDSTEVYNYFVWRNHDAARNSINMLAQSIFSHKELQGKSCTEVNDMLLEKGINWAEYDARLKNGRLIYKLKIAEIINEKEVDRSIWIPKPCPIFTHNTAFIQDLIPKYT